jgi:hypothetical protein
MMDWLCLFRVVSMTSRLVSPAPIFIPAVGYHFSRCHSLSNHSIVDTEWQIDPVNDDAGLDPNLSVLFVGISLFP